MHKNEPIRQIYLMFVVKCLNWFIVELTSVAKLLLIQISLSYFSLYIAKKDGIYHSFCRMSQNLPQFLQEQGFLPQFLLEQGFLP